MPEPEESQLLAAANALAEATRAIDAALATVLGLLPEDQEVSGFSLRAMASPIGISPSLGRIGVSPAALEGNTGCDEVCNSSCPSHLPGGAQINPQL